MQITRKKPQHILLLISFILSINLQAQNIAVSVASNAVNLTLSGATSISNLSCVLTNSNNTLTITSTISGTLSLSGSPSGVTVDNTAKTTTVDLSTFTTFSGINVIGSTGDDNITIGANGLSLVNANGASNQSISINLGTGTDYMTANYLIAAKGSGNIDITLSRSFSGTGGLSSGTGNITVTCNMQSTGSTGNFNGAVFGGNVTTGGSGNINITAKGGTTNTGNSGVYLYNGKVISCTGSGNVTITGYGGPSTNSNNYGINISNTGSKITAYGGKIIMYGYGGGTGSSSGYNFGISVHNSSYGITNYGTDTSASITMIGVGGTGTNDSEIGLDIQDTVSTSGGHIIINGTGGADAGIYSANIAVLIRSTGFVKTGGNGNIYLTGTATAVRPNSEGLYFQASTKLVTNNGDIHINTSSHGNNWGIRYSNFTNNAIIAGGNHNIYIRTNKANHGTTNAGTGNIYYKAYGNNTISLGGNDAASVLGLSASELGYFTCTNLFIGDSTESAPIDLAASINPASVSTLISLHTDSSLSFTGGTLSVGARTLDIFAKSMSGSGGNIDASNASAHLIFRNSSNVRLPVGMFSGNINNLTISGSGSLTLGDSTNISGTLSLTGGDLNIDTSNLTLSGSINMSASNNIGGGSNARLRIKGTGSSSIGTIFFDGGSAQLHTLEIDRSGASGNNPVINLGSDLTVSNRLILSAGKMALGNNLMTFNGTTLVGGDSLSYLQINGSGGLKRPGGSSVIFPIGYNPFLPVTLSCIACGTIDFTARVDSTVTDENNFPFSTGIVNATWQMSADSIIEADLSFQWPISSERGMSHTAVSIGNRTSTSSTWGTNGSPQNLGGSGPFSLSFNSFSFGTGVTNLFGIGDASVPLPLEIIDFQATCEKINWTLYDNHSKVELLGSEDGLNWTILSEFTTMDSREPLQHYTYLIDEKSSSVKYFKLKIQNEEESHIIIRECQNGSNDIILYPNPCYDNIQLSSINEEDKIVIKDIYGKIIFESIGSESIDVSGFTPGIYIITIDSRTIKFIKGER